MKYFRRTTKGTPTTRSSKEMQAQAQVREISETLRQEVQTMLQDPFLSSLIQSADDDTQKKFEVNAFFMKCMGTTPLSFSDLNGVNPQLFRQTDLYGCLPLHYIVSNKNASLAVVQYVLELFPDSVNVGNRAGWLPIHKACYYNASPSVIGYLIKKNPNTVRKPELHKGRLPLHLAMEQQPMNQQAVKCLVQAYPASANIPSPSGGKTWANLVIQEQKGAMPKENSQANAVNNVEVNVIVLLLNPESKRFELVEVGLPSTSSVGDVLKNIPVVCTDSSIRATTFCGILGYPPGSPLPINTLLVAIPDGLSPNALEKMAAPILSNPSVKRLLSTKLAASGKTQHVLFEF